jgi:hypothetical protein
MQPIALLAVASVLLAGCAGSTPSSHGSASASAAYVARGEAICASELAKIDKLTRPTTPGEAVTYLPRVLRIMRRETRELVALEPPASQRAQLAASLEKTRQLAALLGRFLHELQSGLVEISTFARIQGQSDALKADIDSSFRQAGLARCAQ